MIRALLGPWRCWTSDTFAELAVTHLLRCECVRNAVCAQLSKISRAISWITLTSLLVLPGSRWFGDLRDDGGTAQSQRSRRRSRSNFACPVHSDGQSQRAERQRHCKDRRRDGIRQHRYGNRTQLSDRVPSCRLARCEITLEPASTFLLGNLPFGLAPGMVRCACCVALRTKTEPAAVQGLNSYFTYGVCLHIGLTWQVALAAVFFQGVLFMILSASGACSMIQAYGSGQLPGFC